MKDTVDSMLLGLDGLKELIVQSTQSEAVEFAEWCLQNYSAVTAKVGYQWQRDCDFSVKNPRWFTTTELYNSPEFQKFKEDKLK